MCPLGGSDEESRDGHSFEANSEPPAKTDAKAQDLAELLRKSGVSLLLKLLGGISALTVTLVSGRTLGTSGAGLFFLSLAIVTVAAAICRLGLDHAITRFVSEARERSEWQSINGMYVRAIATILVISISVSVALFLMAPTICSIVFGERQLAPVFRWMSLAISGFAITWIHSQFFQGLGEIKAFQIFQNLAVTSIFLAVLGVAVLIRPPTPEMFGKCFLFASVCSALIAHFQWARTHPWFSWRGSTAGWQNVLPTLAPFMGMIVLQQLTNWLPQISLGVFRPAHEVGVYSASFRLANLTSLVLIGVNSVVFPKFAALYSSGELGRMKALAQSSARLMAIACLPFLSILVFLPSEILSWFGSGFADGALVLQIIALGQLVNVITGSVGGLLSMTGNQASCFRCGLVSFVTMAILLLGLTSSLGMIGTAIAQAIGVSVNMTLLSIACYRIFGFAPLRVFPIRLGSKPV